MKSRSKGAAKSKNGWWIMVSIEPEEEVICIGSVEPVSPAHSESVSVRNSEFSGVVKTKNVEEFLLPDPERFCL